MKKIIISGVLFLLLVVAGALVVYERGMRNVLEPEEAKAKAEKFINENLLSPGMKAVIKSVVEEDGLYNITLEVAGSSYNSYMTMDGKKFFQSGIDIEEVEKNNEATKDQSQNTPAVADKSDKPNVELFVMSHCPYGTQIEKGILPVLNLLGDKIDFELKFCDYAMHSKKELDEQLVQYCIQKEARDKLFSYLSCFLIDGDSQACLIQSGIDIPALNNCISKTDEQFKVTEKYNDQSTWSGGRFPVFDVYKSDNEKYSVQGSPVLVINEAKVSSGRDQQSLLKVICSAFNEEPAECQQELSSDIPSPGFGEGTSATSGGGCVN